MNVFHSVPGGWHCGRVCPGHECFKVGRLPPCSDTAAWVGSSCRRHHGHAPLPVARVAATARVSCSTKPGSVGVADVRRSGLRTTLSRVRRCLHRGRIRAGGRPVPCGWSNRISRTPGTGDLRWCVRTCTTRRRSAGSTCLGRPRR